MTTPSPTLDSVQQLSSFLERIEKLIQDKEEILKIINEILAEAKRAGFLTKAIRQILKDRKMEREELMVHTEAVDQYRAALKMLPTDS